MSLPTPFYSDPWTTIYCADNKDILPYIEKVDLILADPPYGINYVHGEETHAFASKFNSEKIVGDHKPFDPKFLMQYGKSHILWGANHYADKLPVSRGWLVWDKRENSVVNDQSDCELAWTDFLTTARIFYHTWDGFRRKTENNIPRVHPTQKPVELMRWCMNFVPDAKTICDPFMGSGTTLVAAKSLNRKSIGVEISETYAKIAVQRLKQEYLAL